MKMEKKRMIDHIRSKAGFICNMDGVIYHGNRILDGVKEFVAWLKDGGKKFVFLTNSSERTIRELHEKLFRMGIDVGQDHFYTSALATATFLPSQKPDGSACIIGEAGLINALYNIGYTSNNIDPDYVVMGEARSYSYEAIEKAVNLVTRGGQAGWDQSRPYGSHRKRHSSGNQGTDFSHRTGYRETGLFRGEAQSADDADRS
jgi:NagD protein